MSFLKKNIKNYNLDDLKEEFIKLNEKPYRAEQVFKWIHEMNVTSFEEMTNISLELRKKLEEEFTLCIYNIIRKQESKDGTKKYLFDVLDGLRQCNKSNKNIKQSQRHKYGSKAYKHINKWTSS